MPDRTISVTLSDPPEPTIEVSRYEVTLEFPDGPVTRGVYRNREGEWIAELRTGPASSKFESAAFALEAAAHELTQRWVESQAYHALQAVLDAG